MVLGPRFLIEAAFIIAVAVVAGIERVGTWSIIGIVAGAWLVVAAVELAMWVRQPAVKRPVRAEAAEPPVEAWAPPPAAERPVRAERGPVEGARGNREVLPLQPVPEPGPEPEPEPAPEPEPEPRVAYLPVNAEPREWNLWELERVARDHVSDDAARNEELAYLLVYLREFAGPDGDLPPDFDGLVRDAFGDLLRVAT